MTGNGAITRFVVTRFAPLEVFPWHAEKTGLLP